MGRPLRGLPVGLYAIHASTTGCIATLLPHFAPVLHFNHRLCRASGAPVFNRGTKSNLGFELLHILLKVELKGVPIAYPL